MPALRTQAAAKHRIASGQPAPPAAATRTARYAYRHHDTMTADSKDNLIFLPEPPAATAGNTISMRPECYKLTGNILLSTNLRI
jgi:hypothetical protein